MNGALGGIFSYAIPASPESTPVVLHFAARHRGWKSAAHRRAMKPAARVDHIFNVFCNGKAILENFDLAREARGTDVVVWRAAGLEPNTQGQAAAEFLFR